MYVVYGDIGDRKDVVLYVLPDLSSCINMVNIANRSNFKEIKIKQFVEEPAITKEIYDVIQEQYHADRILNKGGKNNEI